jgi:ankyrin repeat protein
VGTSDNFKVTVTTTGLPSGTNPQPNGLKKPEPAIDGVPGQLRPQSVFSPNERQGWDKSLHDAATAGETDRVRFLLSKGADVDARDADGMTPLMKAAKEGHRGTVEFLVRSGADPNAIDAGRRGNPLIFAILSGNLETVKALVNYGADVNGGAGGWTPLGTAQYHEFSKHKNSGILEFLESRGAK